MLSEKNLNKYPNFIELAFGDGTPRKAVITALVVGTILTLINHGDEILLGKFNQFWKPILTYFVPYCVTTWGSVMGKKSQWELDHKINIKWKNIFFKNI